MDHVEKYLPIVETLAAKALDLAINASPTKPREGEHVRSLMEWVPAAKALLSGESVGIDYLPTLEAIRDGTRVRFRDGRGHSRPHYLYLAAGLHRAGLGVHPVGLARDAGVVSCAGDELGDAFELPWLSNAVNDQFDMSRDWLDMEVGALESDTPMHPPDVDTTPDEWTFAEMGALHGLFNAAIAIGHDAGLAKAHAAARYHLQHTQPDYTTYQPWALAAFLYFPDTVGFAEQQLHDVETHLHVEGPPGALVPGLLLADAVATLREAAKRD
ncbi:MAG: hypothetical protein AAGE65_01545 [Planctomycetota bacterium]